MTDDRSRVFPEARVVLDTLLGLWQDTDRLRSWLRGNLGSYWRPWRASTERLPSRGGWASLPPELTERGVLGVIRLRSTLANGRIASTRGAGACALEAFPARWHRIVREAIRLRERRPDGAFYVPNEAAAQLVDV